MPQPIQAVQSVRRWVILSPARFARATSVMRLIRRTGPARRALADVGKTGQSKKRAGGPKPKAGVGARCRWPCVDIFFFARGGRRVGCRRWPCSFANGPTGNCGFCRLLLVCTGVGCHAGRLRTLPPSKRSASCTQTRMQHNIRLCSRTSTRSLKTQNSATVDKRTLRGGPRHAMPCRDTPGKPAIQLIEAAAPP